jgi:hypothetical protein
MVTFDLNFANSIFRGHLDFFGTEAACLITGRLKSLGIRNCLGLHAPKIFVTSWFCVKVTPLASPVSTTYTGTATVELGNPPEGTTGIQMEFWCLTPGWFEFPDGAARSCSDEDAASERLGWSGDTIGLAPGQDSVTIKTDPHARWRLTAKYVKQERTPLGVNAKGETYGVESPENGTPDLIAVVATNGQSGYAYARDLKGGPMPTSPEDAAKNFSTPRPPREIPVFESDGETRVGVFMASGSEGGVPAYPSASPRP